MTKVYKHKFYLINKETNEELWLADCRDSVTADNLADFYRGLYEKASHLTVVYRYKNKRKNIVE